MADTGSTPATRSMGFIAKLRDWLDLWPTHVLQPDELAATRSFEAWLKAHWFRALAASLVCVAVLSLCLYTLVPRVGFLDWFIILGFALLGLILSLVGAYYGYRRHHQKYGSKHRGLWWMVGVSTAVAAAVTGRHYASGQPFMEVLGDQRLWAMLVMAFIVVWGLMLGMNLIAKLRVNEADLLLAKANVETESERLAKRNAEAELKLMQAQVEPHFLYNTLANLRYLIQSGSPQALDMTDHLIDYLRVSLPSFRSDFTTLGREVELSRAYLAIMEIRMGGKLRWNIDVPHALTDVKLPPLMLLTLIENAVKHGIGRATDGGDIRISASRDGDHVVIAVADTGAGLSHTPSTSATKPKGSGVGLANVRERLKAVYGDAATLALASNQPRGVVATISLRQCED